MLLNRTKLGETVLSRSVLYVAIYIIVCAAYRMCDARYDMPSSTARVHASGLDRRSSRLDVELESTIERYRMAIQ